MDVIDIHICKTLLHESIERMKFFSKLNIEYRETNID